MIVKLKGLIVKTIIKYLTSFSTSNVISVLSLIANIILSIVNRRKSFNFQKSLEDQKQKFNEKIELFKSNNAHNIQIQEYFKKLGTEKQSKILSEWADFVTDLDAFQKNFKDTKKFKEMKHNIVMYGSGTTVKILASFIHYTYENNISSDPYKGIVYATFVISSLKNDFSGYLTDPVDYLKLQMNDFSKYKDKLLPYFDEIRKENNLDW